VFVGSLDLTAVHSVYQRVEILSEDEKRTRLYDFLTKELGEDDKVIVFMGRKCAVDNITAEFALTDIRCQSIHGGREQYDREQVCGNFPTLVAMSKVVYGRAFVSKKLIDLDVISSR
jgi:ATP-dependent RNA helicase DDX43